MEPEGDKLIFGRSIIRYCLRYNEFYGDEESKSFAAVEHVYEKDHGVVIQKKECVGHVHKQLGMALVNWRRQKGLGGEGKLTDNMIDKLQNYYGIAIRINSGNFKAMESDVVARLWHCTSMIKSHYIHIVLEGRIASVATSMIRQMEQAQQFHHWIYNFYKYFN
jgi:hypothetical protein